MPIPEIEKQSAREIKSFQEKALKNLFQYLEANSKFYKSHFKANRIHIDKIKYLEDLVNIPPTRKEDLQTKALILSV